VPSLDEASQAARSALAGFRAAPAWPAAPRPVPAGDLLPERALAGDVDARRTLRNDVFSPLVRSGGELLETLDAFLAAGGVLESAARSLFVHPNTVRYRLRRIGDITGFAPWCRATPLRCEWHSPSGGWVRQAAAPSATDRHDHARCRSQ